MLMIVWSFVRADDERLSLQLIPDDMVRCVKWLPEIWHPLLVADQPYKRCLNPGLCAPA